MCKQCLDDFRKNFSNMSARPMAGVIALIAVEEDGDVTIIREEDCPPDIMRRVVHEAIDKADWTLKDDQHMATGFAPAPAPYSEN